MELVQESELTRSALEAARAVLKARYCAVAWRVGEAVAVIATQGVSTARAESLAPAWLACCTDLPRRPTRSNQVVAFDSAPSLGTRIWQV